MNLSRFLEEHAGPAEAAAWRLGEQCHVVLVDNIIEVGPHGVHVAALRANDGGPPLPTDKGPRHGTSRLQRGWWRNRGFEAITDVLSLTPKQAAVLVASVSDAFLLQLPVGQMRIMRPMLVQGVAVELDYSPFSHQWSFTIHVDGEALWV